MKVTVSNLDINAIIHFTKIKFLCCFTTFFCTSLSKSIYLSKFDSPVVNRSCACVCVTYEQESLPRLLAAYQDSLELLLYKYPERYCCLA